MQTTLKIICCFLFLFALGVSCSDNGKDRSTNDGQALKVINPNGDSELALLMRAMFEEAQQVKKQISEGKPVRLNLDHQKILSAHATEPEKAASAEYRAFAATYLQTVRALQTADSSQALAIYDTMVENCMTCHRSLCPGPMVRIKKLQ